MANEVKIMKDFRDDVLLKNAVGRALVKFYYKVSPQAADFIAKHDNLRMLVRWGLLPIVGISWIALTFGLAPMAAFLVLLLGFAVWIFVYSKRKAHYPAQ